MVTRADLPPGVRATQAIHAALQYAARYPVHDTLVFLEARDELALCWLCAEAHRRGLCFAPFREPDLDDALTAVALEGVLGGAGLCRKFPLALGGGERHGQVPDPRV